MTKKKVKVVNVLLCSDSTCFHKIEKHGVSGCLVNDCNCMASSVEYDKPAALKRMSELEVDLQKRIDAMRSALIELETNLSILHSQQEICQRPPVQDDGATE